MTWITQQRFKLTEQISGWKSGEGPTLVLIHGVGMCADYWANLLPALQPCFSLVLIDLPGHGSSPVSLSCTTINDYAECIVPVLRNCNGPVFIAGHSMGALISIELAHRYPQHVRAIAVLNGVFQRDNTASLAVQKRADSLDGQSLSDPEPTLERWFGQTPVGVEAEAALHCRKSLLSINPVGYQYAYKAFAYDNGPTVENLKKIACPALYTTGEWEPNSTPTMSQTMAEHTPQGEYYLVKQARHMMSMTHAEELVDVMTSFFQRVPTSQ